jgi:putative transposase
MRAARSAFSPTHIGRYGAKGAEMVRLIDASLVQLGRVCKWATWNGRIRGMKMHVVYDLGADVPRCVEITFATVNDVGCQWRSRSATYVFDYCHFGWWKKKAFIITRRNCVRKPRARLSASQTTRGSARQQRDSGLAIPLRRIRLRRAGRLRSLTGGPLYRDNECFMIPKGPTPSGMLQQ